MPHGQQNDTFSCGPATGNTIAHDILGCPLWSPETAVLERVCWFLKFVENIPSLVEDTSLKDRIGMPPSQDNDAMKAATAGRSEMNIEVSIAIAIGDHNFPDLADFVAEGNDHAQPHPCARQRISLLELLNPDDDPVATHESFGRDLNEEFRSDEDVNLTEYPSSLAEEMGVSSGVDLSEETNGDEERMVVDEEKVEKNKFMSYFTGSRNENSVRGKETELKRKREPKEDVGSPSDSGSDSDVSARAKGGSKKARAGTGQSKAAKYSRSKRESFRNGTLKIDDKALENWKKKILTDDQHAEFDPSNITRVRHSGCGRYFQVKEPLDLTRWRIHMKECKPNKKSAKTRSLFAMGWGQNAGGDKAKTAQHVRIKASVVPTKPCPGLTELDDGRIPNYLYRSAAHGGGGKSIQSIAKEKFNQLFSKLSKRKKDEVLDHQQHGHTWTNDHQKLRVFSATCQKAVSDRTPNRALPCESCQSVLSSKGFRAALRKPTPSPENQIYVNTKYRNQVLGEIYGRHIGLKDIIEAPVRSSYFCERFVLILSK